MTFMEKEAREAPEAVARFLDLNGPALQELGTILRKRQPPVVITSARGSSDHAAAYFKYLTEIATGVPCASVGASVASVYQAPLKASGALCLTISQSGKSPDIVALQEAAKKAGALTVALVNVEDSPAGRSADICLALHAGVEKSVAATKSMITSMVAGAAIVAAWRDDAELKKALAQMPEALRAATKLHWPQVEEMMLKADSLYVLGRGPAFPVAAETALKLKETCAVHAESYSVAEVMHGPLELVSDHFPVVVYAQNDQSIESTQQAIARLRQTGAEVTVVGAGGVAVAHAGHPLLEPISLIQTAYLAIESVARQRGRNPDEPRHLKKVTETR